ncbi:FadR/GntR family transcriptional regulator [Noviherbaspirillum saxi]|uniref:FadR family transcriptional regulator n=1 Tax=Noviherbaspirillum saxi TaxID=2320863 RepID=A0A3A3FK34_9BURK|nr:FadR/GntR family transcriptional regulator [Noviherbaspirillum saxi]RJF95863.1 FadR family transcriptional regulator [Noviherbaspirillum saxi]
MELLTRLPGGETDIVKRTVKHQLADKLAYMILSGLLQPGDELPSERALASTLEVSRETVRGAIGELHARGMLEVSQGARTRVIGPGKETLVSSVRALAKLKDKGVDEVAEARIQVEVQVVKLAATRISKSDLERLRVLVAQQKLMINDPVTFQISDRELHTIIYAACGNSLLRDFVSDMYDYALDYRRQALKRKGAIAQSVQDHERIVEALATGNPQLAEEALTHHLQHVHKSTVQEMKR